MINPIDKDKVAEFPGLLAYPHNIGSIMVKPEDEGKIKSRALSAMYNKPIRSCIKFKSNWNYWLIRQTKFKNEKK